MKRLLTTIIGLCVAVTTATPAFAGLGFHAGASIDPDNFLLGVRFKTHPIEESFFIVPNVEVGFGDVTMLAGNLDGYYAFETSSDLRPYAGAGLTINWFDFDGGSDTEFGGCILGGIYLKTDVFLEAKIGLGDVPDWKFIIGWNR